MQEHILHIKMMKRPGAGDEQGEHGADCGRLDYQVKCLIVVDTGSLSEATKDPASLLPFQRAIEAELVLKNPFVGDDIGANGARDIITGVVGDQGSKFFFDGAVPVQTDEGGTNGGGH
jgi:hypothetical protein